ncbi:hypothetical protein N308_03952, partial [Struthio camelus australis]
NLSLSLAHTRIIINSSPSIVFKARNTQISSRPCSVNNS